MARRARRRQSGHRHGAHEQSVLQPTSAVDRGAVTLLPRRLKQARLSVDAHAVILRSSAVG
jgi:hypothetical protein